MAIPLPLSFSISPWPTGLPLLWLISLAGMLASGLFLSNTRHVALHARIALLPALLAIVLALLSARNAPYPLAVSGTPLAWLMASLILGLGAIVQHFSVRFLQGDRDQPRALLWFSVLTASAALCWLQHDLRLMLLAWGAALHALTNLIGLTRDWAAARAARRRAERWLSVAWLALAGLIVLNAWETGSWQLDQWQPERWQAWAQQLGAALLLVAVLIPAAQWPAQRWLMESMVAPTPVSAIMHAGMVNAGGVLLLYFGSLLALADWARALLLLLAIASIVTGCGMALVQADIKRQLAASTVAQMACMLLQIALGAYLAAIVHLVLHGLFKAALFLQAGGAPQGVGAVNKTPAAGENGEGMEGNTATTGATLAPLQAATSGRARGLIASLRQRGGMLTSGGAVLRVRTLPILTMLVLVLVLVLVLTLLMLWPAGVAWLHQQAGPVLASLDAASVVPNLILLLALLQSLPLLARQWMQWRVWRTLLLALGGMFACQWLLGQFLGSSLPAAPLLAPVWMWATLGLLLAGALLLSLARRLMHQAWARRLYWHFVAASEADGATQDAHPAYLAHRLQQGVLA